jgi:peptide-methionine (S)-S-oxide reductase
VTLARAWAAAAAGWLALAAGACSEAEGAGQGAAAPGEGRAVAIFAGGCFWCMEPPFDALPGVIATTSGYTGGTVEDPSYEQVSSGSTGHLEAVSVEYDPVRVRYDALLEVFWRNVDPTDAGGQFCDRGEQYTTAIFAVGEEQLAAATASKQKLAASGRLARPVVTAIRSAGRFYPAEDYHQNYYEKNPIRYKFYRTGCGRDRVLEQLWGASRPARSEAKPSEDRAGEVAEQH